MNIKRPIDRSRDAAAMMEVGTADDASPIRDIFPIGDTLHVIKEKGIYICRLADEIDPGRTNPKVPNVQQRVLAYGTDSILVRQTLLTAKRLFNPAYLSPSIDTKVALVVAFDFLTDLAALQDMASAFVSAENAAIVVDRRSIDGSVVLPRVGDVRAHCTPFIQKADHSIRSLFGIAKLFYAQSGAKHWGKGDWFQSLATLVKRRHGSQDQFSKFVDAILPVLQFIRNARHSVEHPNATQRMVTTDFALSPQMQIVPPSIEIVHPKTPQPAAQASPFMSQAIEQLGGIFELMIAFMCARHPRPDDELPFEIIELPKDWQVAQHVRYSWGLRDRERVIPAG